MSYRDFVFFDYGGTLEQTFFAPPLSPTFCATARAELKAVLTPHGVRRAGVLLESDAALLERFNTWFAQEGDRRHSSERELTTARMWHEILRIEPVDTCQGFEDVAEELTCEFETAGHDRRMRPDALETLERLLSRGWRLGIISNVITRLRVPREMDAFGLTRYFDPIILSSTYGYRKPDPSIFHHAARLAGVPVRSCWYVGDTVSRDVLGTNRAGYAGCIRITGGNREKVVKEQRSRFDPAFFEPAATIERLSELPDVLARLRAQGTPWRPLPPPRRAEPWVKAVLFDASDVLYYRPSKHKAFSAFLERHGAVPTAETAARIHQQEKEAFTGAVSIEEHYRFRLQLYGIHEPAAVSEGLAALQADSDAVATFDGVRETLQALANQGILLGVITNTVLTLHDKLAFFERGGYGHLWDSIILSTDVGFRKPDAQIYLAGVEQLGVRVQECAFVGHESYEIDGAREAGLHTVSFNCDPSIGAERHMRAFGDLVELVLNPQSMLQEQRR